MNNMLDVPYTIVKHEKHFLLNNVLMTLQERINDLFKEHPKKKNADLARFVGCSRATVTDWRNGNTKKIDGENAYKVAAYFSVNPEWVLAGKGPKQKKSELVITQNSTQDEVNIAPGPIVHGKVPLISWVQAGHAVEVVDLLHLGEGFDLIDTTCQIRRHTYALRVQGDSMSPDFPEGCIIVVEPEMEPIPGDYVIAKNGDEEATFKQFIKDGADYYLKPMNERYPIKPLGAYHVVGVVRELVRRFR